MVLGGPAVARPAVKPGIEVLVEKRLDLVRGRKVGLVTNPTGVDSRLRATADILHEHPDVALAALFGPEHGIRGGVVKEDIGDAKDARTGLPAYSLYGATRRPTEKMLAGLDALLFDVQDIGSRTYTYISTMRLCMEEAAKRKIAFIVLDRPNPLSGVVVDGPVLDPAFGSFVGTAPIPYVHGMTIGELARFFNEELKINCDLTVVPMEGWTRAMTWRETGLDWVPPSPHIPEPDSPWYYPITGILGELPFTSIGVGYTMPFKLVGAPWMDAQKAADDFNAQKMPGVVFQPFHFEPFYGRFKGEFCGGVRIVVTEIRDFRPVEVCYRIIASLMRLYPAQCSLRQPGIAEKLKMFDKINGTDRIRMMLEEGTPVEKIVAGYRPEVEAFMKKRAKYLIYR